MGMISGLVDRWDKGIAAFRHACRSVIYMLCVLCYVALFVQKRSQSFLIVISIINFVFHLTSGRL